MSKLNTETEEEIYKGFAFVEYQEDNFCICCKKLLEPVDPQICWDCEYDQFRLFPDTDDFYFAGLLEESKEWMQ
jgi:hypothetical protein